MRPFDLPPVITDLVLARNRLRDHYISSGLNFTLDGNLIGDIGEAVAAESRITAFSAKRYRDRRACP
ncbi:hypothetical protein DFI02_1164 [Rhizobium sp. PP-F2F-G20b]|nr:hypothetical protein DFI02_1164 [Rhizobium sp. PP-F2F-G20b]